MSGQGCQRADDEGYPLVGVRKPIQPRWRRSEWPVTLLTALPLLIFGRSLQPGRIFSAADNLFLVYPWHALEPSAVPQNSLLTDRTYVFEPWLIYAARQIHNGRFPLWNPHAYAGAPLLGNFQSALLFPLTALAYAVPVQTALGMIAILKIVIAGLSMYWMLGVLGLEPLAATAGALAFMFSGCMIVWLGWPVTNVAIWLPLLVGLTERLRETGAWRYAGWLSLVVGVQFLGGHPEMSFFILVLTGCYALFCGQSPAVTRFIGQFAAGGAIGGLIAAVQLLPFFHYLVRSAAVLFRHQTHIVWVLPLRAIIALLIPNYFGNPVSGNFWGPNNYNAISGSVGVLPWILAPSALLGTWYRRETKFFLGAANFLGLVVYDGRPVPWLLAQLPGFSVAVNPRLNIVLAFSLAVLCGFGMQVLTKAPLDTRLPIIRGIKLVFLLLLAMVAGYLIADARLIFRQHLAFYVGFQSAVFVLLLLAGTLVSIHALQLGACDRKLGMCLLTIEILSLLTVASSYNPIIKSKEFYPTPPALKFLQKDRGLFRVLLPLPNVGALYGLSDVTGYDALTPRRLEQLVDAPDALFRTGGGMLQFAAPLSSQVSNLTNLKYVLLAPGAASPSPSFRLAYDGLDGRIYQNMNVFPRAFLVPSARTCLNDSSALALIRSGKIDLRREVIISGCPHLISGVSPSGTLRIEKYEAQRIDLHADIENPAFLVLADNYDTDWRARVDRNEVPLLRADYTFRAVALSPGSHKIEFLYHPPTVIFGLVLSIAGLVSSAALMWFGEGG
jgi:hypothetical protein